MKKLIIVVAVSSLLLPLMWAKNYVESLVVQPTFEQTIKQMFQNTQIEGKRLLDKGCAKFHQKVEQQKLVNTPKKRLVDRKTSLRFVDDAIELVEQGFDAGISTANEIKKSVTNVFSAAK